MTSAHIHTLRQLARTAHDERTPPIDVLVESVVRNISPKDATIALTVPPTPMARTCAHCASIGTVIITMQQTRACDEGETAVATCCACGRRNGDPS